jgi:hypothetical protein
MPPAGHPPLVRPVFIGGRKDGMPSRSLGAKRTSGEKSEMPAGEFSTRSGLEIGFKVDGFLMVTESDRSGDGPRPELGGVGYLSRVVPMQAVVQILVDANVVPVRVLQGGENVNVGE